MKMPVMIRAIGLGLLTAVICGLAWKTTLAEGPPVWWGPNERAVLESMPRGPGFDPYNIAYYNVPKTFPNSFPMPPTGLIPTNWESNSQLIPTEIDVQTLPVQQSLFSIFSMNAGSSHQTGNAYVNRQARVLARRAPAPAIIQLPANSESQTGRAPMRLRPGTPHTSRVARSPHSTAGRLQSGKHPTSDQAVAQQK